jgi:FkbH-like protein
VTLTEALTILKNQPAEGAPFEVLLACGFTTLHIEKLLGAHLQKALPERRVVVRTGLFGDLCGTLEAVPRAPLPDSIAIAMEWPDLDPRLGYRQLGGWGPEQEADIATTVSAFSERMISAVKRLPAGLPVALSLPTLPLPPAFYTPGWQAGKSQWAAEGGLADLARGLSEFPQVRIANRERIAELGGARRQDLSTELFTGLPYRLEHASAVAQVLAWLIHTPAPKKGLITDLDDTLWHGLVGEVGPDGVSWDLASHSQIHGLYQQLLAALADTGVLLAVASKNDPKVVEQALRRSDVVLPPGRVFPMEVGWHPKSGSVSRILETWNISADAAVFVDDSPLELAEVAAAHPGITCLPFPGNPEQALQLFRQLRDLFGKSQLSAEDSYRLESIRKAAEFQEASAELGEPSNEFLAGLQAEIGIDLDGSAGDARVLELVNKTNQFNLNGIRCTEADWHKRMQRPGAFLAVVSYRDKFGPLGKIAVLQGSVKGTELEIDTWVMSCRAFARRIEQRCLIVLFEEFGVETAALQFKPTNKNGPLRDFLGQMADGTLEEGRVKIARALWESRCPRLHHAVEIKRAETKGATEHSVHG